MAAIMIGIEPKQETPSNIDTYNYDHHCMKALKLALNSSPQAPTLSGPYCMLKDLGLSCVSAEDQLIEGLESPVT